MLSYSRPAPEASGPVRNPERLMTLKSVALGFQGHLRLLPTCESATTKANAVGAEASNGLVRGQDSPKDSWYIYIIYIYV